MAISWCRCEESHHLCASTQEVGASDGHGAHQEGSGGSGLRDASLPSVLPKIQSGTALHAGHGDSLHLQVLEPPRWLSHAQVALSMTSLPASSGITCGLKVTLPPTMPNGERRRRRTRWSGKRTLSRTWWSVGTARSTTSALWASAGTRCPTSWSWTHRCGHFTSLLTMLMLIAERWDRSLKRQDNCRYPVHPESTSEPVSCRSTT